MKLRLTVQIVYSECVSPILKMMFSIIRIHLQKAGFIT